MKIPFRCFAPLAVAFTVAFASNLSSALELKPGHARPLVAVVGDNSMTEVTDFIVPYSVLKESGAADVVALGLKPGAIRMSPVLAIQADDGIDGFDARHPEGADYVIVPAVHDRTNAALLAWVRRQSDKGATMVGICDGLWVLANAGLVDGKRITGHWFSRDGMRRNFPAAQWIDDQRYVVDSKLMTTTGISASIPASLALVETIAGRQRAAEVAASIGVSDWSPDFDGRPFHLSSKVLLAVAGNQLAFWTHEDVAIPVADGVDELALALTADAYSRTYRSQAYTLAPSFAPVTSRRGLVILPDRSGVLEGSSDRIARLTPSPDAGNALDLALQDIGQAYGARTAALVALQLEYPRP
jgi:putative intracellular protease/amidase